MKKADCRDLNKMFTVMRRRVWWPFASLPGRFYGTAGRATAPIKSLAPCGLQTVCQIVVL